MAQINELVDIKTGEVVSETALATIERDSMLALVRDNDKPIFQAMASMQSLDWKHIPPPQMALLLMAKPYTSGGGTMFLNFRQALLFAVRCFELQLSPFSDNVWYDVTRGAVNLTMSGKRELARLRNIEMGPPLLEEVTREWDTVPKISTAGEEAKKAGFARDLGCKCTIRVGPPANKETVSYVAWVNDWFQSRSPVWKEKPSHMLAIRANEKALTLILGAGASQLPDEKEVE